MPWTIENNVNTHLVNEGPPVLTKFFWRRSAATLFFYSSFYMSIILIVYSPLKVDCVV